MVFVNWLASIIAREVMTMVKAQLVEYMETKTKINAVTSEAKSLMGELDNAQSESEKKAILRKIANFSDVSKNLL